MVNVFRIYFDLGYFAFERLGYGLKLSQAQKSRRKRLNYSTSVDDEHLKDANSMFEEAQKKVLNRRESVASFHTNSNREQGKLELRRRSCVENSLETRSPTTCAGQSLNPIIKIEIKDRNKANDKLIDDKVTNGKIKNDKIKNDKVTNDKLTNRLDKNADVYLESEFSSLSMLANVSELSRLERSSNSSLSTSTVSNEENRFLTQLDDKLPMNLKTKLRRLNFRQQQTSIDNYQQENGNCILM